ncbi:MAG: carbonic anhydrase family protein [Thermodesulfobacteriota bacterium]|nr:MAG: carbonic anhydrase family protein [Thermodesulfobacteriota bacterium]
MKSKNKRGLMKRFPLFLAVLFFSVVLGSNAFASSKGHDKHWSYEGDTGPAYWGELSEKFEACSEGKSQSPIDIRETVKVSDGKVKFNYKPTRIRILNNGHAIQVNYDKGSYIKVAGVRYDLLQLHFHSPSENTVAGKHSDIEMHLVHKNKKGELAVVGVLIEKGPQNKAYEGIWANLPAKKGKEMVVKGKVNAIDLTPAKKSYYSFSGSLTTPPCSENVAWFLLKTPVKLSPAQIKAFRKIMKGDNRPVQPLNGRKVMEISG